MVYPSIAVSAVGFVLAAIAVVLQLVRRRADSETPGPAVATA